MAQAVDVVLLPFRAVWRLIKLLILPVLFGVAAAGLALLGLDWSWAAFAVCVVWAAVMVRLWLVQIGGELRSLGRGTVNVRTKHGSSR
ncbi:hypothetical protein IQ251_14125 [Saccharopolyspora sp. HNM0983]|uniref:Uncharacterized protein n=1 Tax=Saccharopolyspora montiporae TaxID=2781240 RepID=A0A929BB45_9PSEU|nr:hypothetical protein [Saccharopolyspora sp. HNM0983]MBE9375586.1 hypothetical protein [Saccharopolyspora sp. HNM0983]